MRESRVVGDRDGLRTSSGGDNIKLERTHWDDTVQKRRNQIEKAIGRKSLDRESVLDAMSVK